MELREVHAGVRPGDLAADREAVSGRAVPPRPLTFSVGSEALVCETKGGTVRIADSRNFAMPPLIPPSLVGRYTLVGPDCLPLQVWRSDCATCGGPFEIHDHDQAAVLQYPSRRCGKHRRPGVRV
jgi:hypothetical protein